MDRQTSDRKTADRLVLIGRFGAPHGVRGELRLQSFTENPAAISSYGPLTDRLGAKAFSILTARAVKPDLFVVKLKGVDDRTAAEALTNVEVFVAREKLPAAAEDEFYLADLIGLEALDASRAPFGRVKNVLDFGAGDILEIEPAGGGETLLLPFTRQVAPEIDLAAGFIVIDPPVERAAPAFLQNDETDAAASPPPSAS
ncbi:16S rRNA processing protein RimM [Methylocella silvestris BL2]|uniref:Ribosome maturation factor RimM n=1 Tax=Methylocella silvestris (strain DSM 15510 / CIP 108128 / LMG 27833 / NCIMB 13906 / BL2) TaxID=395965 RepID=B8ETG1_METSB|nr:ribosome maturation factor RimM [Methylocella silvestris]ACK51803.1 16S rRNA processing protein RimM [Methylocella silvestris BL2]